MNLIRTFKYNETGKNKDEKRKERKENVKRVEEGDGELHQKGSLGLVYLLKSSSNAIK